MSEVGQLKPRRDKRLGIYAHIPFCERVCPYCDFAVTAKRKVPHEAYADAVIAELAARAPSAMASRELVSVYFGGGTPSRLAPEQLARILAAILAFDPSQRQHVQEITLEANPTDITDAHLDVWLDAGVNRISLGVQSFEPELLSRLGRNHDAGQAIEAIERILARRGVKLSIDLIFGGPGQTMALWERDLAMISRFVAQGLSHISCYNLTIEPKTPFARLVARGELEPVDEDGCAAMMERLIEVAGGLGFEHYEVSSLALGPSARAVHNSGYWLGAEYLGLGVGAHSLMVTPAAAMRRANGRHLAPYLADAVGGGQAQLEVVSALDHLLERLYVNLRTTFGLSWDELCWQFEDAVDAEVMLRVRELLEQLVRDGLLACSDSPQTRYSPTPRGLMLADLIAARVFDLLG